MVAKYFEFLIKHGFTCSSEGRPVRYDHANWYIEIWLGNGDNDVILGNKETCQITGLQKLIRTYHKGAFPLLANFPQTPNQSEQEHYLAYASHWLKTYLPAAISS